MFGRRWARRDNPARRPHRPVLRVELLEDRTLPAPLQVAVVASGTKSPIFDGGFAAIRDQLNDSTAFAFNATLVDPADVDTVAELDAYEAVVIGNNSLITGPPGDRFEVFGAALKSWVLAGGGVVAVGYTVLGAGTGVYRNDPTAPQPPVPEIVDVIPVNTAGNYDPVGTGRPVPFNGTPDPGAR